MTDSRFMGRLKWFGAGSVNIIPGFSWFITLSPPLFPKIGIITSALGLAVTYIIYTYTPKQESGKFPPLIRTGTRCIIGALCLILIYVLLLYCCTVLDPQSENARFQIGFGRQDWSLTELGLKYKREMLPSEPVVKWMEADALFYRGGPEKLWKPWSILAAGTLMIVTFVFAFSLWTTGFAFLAKHESRKSFT